MTEAELRSKVVAMAHELGWMVFSLPIAKTRRPVKDAIGYPDLTLCRDRQAVWIELKAEDGDMTTAQLRWMTELPVMVVIRPSDFERGVVFDLLR